MYSAAISGRSCVHQRRQRRPGQREEAEHHVGGGRAHTASNARSHFAPQLVPRGGDLPSS
jgi:hypothetical protein